MFFLTTKMFPESSKINLLPSTPRKHNLKKTDLNVHNEISTTIYHHNIQVNRSSVEVPWVKTMKLSLLSTMSKNRISNKVTINPSIHGVMYLWRQCLMRHLYCCVLVAAVGRVGVVGLSSGGTPGRTPGLPLLLHLYCLQRPRLRHHPACPQSAHTPTRAHEPHGESLDWGAHSCPTDSLTVSPRTHKCSTVTCQIAESNQDS